MISKLEYQTCNLDISAFRPKGCQWGRKRLVLALDCYVKWQQLLYLALPVSINDGAQGLG